MFQVDTLFVISSHRGDYVITDMRAAIAANTNNRGVFTVVVDETGSLGTSASDSNWAIIKSPLPVEAACGFHRAAGLKWAIDAGMAHRQVIFLDDTCLLTAPGLDEFFTKHTQRDGVGVIGVGTRSGSASAWEQGRAQLFEWHVNTDGWEKAPPVLCDDILILSGPFAGRLYTEGLLTPPGCERWLGYGAYLSWVAHMLGFYVVSWGLDTKPLPPLYVSHGQGQYLPAPHLLRSEFLAFSPITKLLSYSESDIRELYKQQRGEPARDVVKLQPLVTGPENRDVK